MPLFPECSPGSVWTFSLHGLHCSTGVLGPKEQGGGCRYGWAWAQPTRDYMAQCGSRLSNWVSASWSGGAEAVRLPAYRERSQAWGHYHWREWQAPCSRVWGPSPMLTRPTGRPDLRGAQMWALESEEICSNFGFAMNFCLWGHCLTSVNISLFI